MLKFIARFSSLLLFLSMLSIGAHANSWTSADIYGGQIWALAMNPHDHNILLAGGIANLYKTTDGAATWQPTGVTGLITGIAFSSGNTNAAYVCTGGSIYNSLDCGVTWARILVSIGFDKLVCDPSAAPIDVLYASDRQVNPAHIYKSADAGNHWNVAYTLPTNFTISRLAMAGDHIIATAQMNYDGDGAIFVGQNAGADWTQIPALDPTPVNRPVYSLAVDPANPDNVYAGGRLLFFKSTDRGAHWSAVDVSGTLGSNGRRTTMLTVAGNNTLLACNGLNLYTSSDGGANWDPAGPVDPSLAGVGDLCDPVSDGVNVYLADSYGAGIYKGTTCTAFQSASSNIKGVRFLFLGRSPVETNVFYAGSDIDTYRTKDSGQTWTPLKGFGGARAGMGDMIVPPTNPASVIAFQPITFSVQSASGGAIVRSDDYGDSWQLMSLMPEFSGGVLKFAFQPGNTLVVYAGLGGGIMSPQQKDGLYISRDGGYNWNMIAVGDFGGSVISNLAIDPGNTLTMYAGKGQFCQQISSKTTGVYKSIDGGDTWTQMPVPADIIITLLLDPDDPAVIYVATKSHGLYKSGDRGATWTKINDQFGISSLVITKTTDNEKVLCFATDNGTIFAGDGNGQNWQSFSRDFAVINVLCPGSLYAGTNAGLYKTEITMLPPPPGSQPPWILRVKAYPNPGRDQISFIMDLNAPTPIGIDLFNIDGERVAKLTNTLNGQGAVLTWNCRGIGPGIYIARISMNGKLAEKLKVAVIKQR